MGDKTEIGWTDHTYNPWRGCAKVSPGCDNCYMFRDQRRYGRDPETVVRAAPATFNAPAKWHRKLAPGGHEWVFTCSWSDFFIKDADPWRDEAWRMIRETPRLTYQILTKRPGLIRARLPDDWGDDGYPNVLLGTSVEDQARAGRLDQLFAVPAAGYFVSLEPLLGAVDISPWMWPVHSRWPAAYRSPEEARAAGAEVTRHRQALVSAHARFLGWAIAGGESGPDCRPLDLDALRSIVTQCREAGVPVYMKQDSGPKPGQRGRIPDDLWIQEMPEVCRG